MNHTRRIVALLTLLALIPVTASAAESTSQPIIATVGSTAILRDEAAFYLYCAQANYEALVRYYDTRLGLDYWSLTDPSGTTTQDSVRAATLRQMLTDTLLSERAAAAGRTLDAVTVQNAQASATALYDGLSESEREETGWTPRALAEAQEKRLLAEQEKALLLEQTTVDEDAITAAIDPADYVTYTVSYYFFYRTDSSRTDALLQSAMLTAARSVPDGEALSASYLSGAAGSNDEITAGTFTFIASDNAVDEVLAGVISALHPGETSGIIQTGIGYFIVRLMDDSSQTAYKNAVKKAVRCAKEAACGETLTAMLEKTGYSVSEDIWRAIPFGIGSTTPASAGNT